MSIADGGVAGVTTSESYFPPPDAEGGWRLAVSDDEAREQAHLDPQVLALIAREQEWHYGGDTWCMTIIRNGFLVDFRTFDAMDSSRFDVWSVTKSFTSLAFGIALDDPDYAGRLDLNSKVYEFIPEGYPLTDARKANVTVGQLLSMTGGFSGHHHLTAGTPTRLGEGVFEHVLGKVTNRYGYDASQLIAEPGTCWEYSDPGFAHLSLVFAHATGSELDTFLNQRLFGRIGVPAPSWIRSGGGKLIGPHVIAHCGLVLSSRELARCGYLLLRGGMWDGHRIVSNEWLTLATRASQSLNPRYGLGFWVNGTGTLWAELPGDAFAMMGHRGNRCWVVPSLDLVVARTGSGPKVMDDRYFPSKVLDALL